MEPLSSVQEPNDWSQPGQLRIDTVVIDPARRVVLADGQPVELEPKAFDLLVYVASHAPRIVTKDELLNAVWKNRVVTEAALYRAVKIARRAFGERGAEVIRTVHGKGYRCDALVTPVERAPPAAGESPSRARFGAFVKYGVAAALLGFVLLLGLQLEPETPPNPARATLSIAVFPFEVRYDEADHLGAELAAELVAELARIDGLMVFGSVSSLAAAGAVHDAVALGRRLGAERVVRGILEHASGRLLANVELLGTEEGRLLWSRNFEQPKSALNLLRREIAQNLAAALAVSPVNAAGEGLPRETALASGVYATFLQARHLWRQRDPSALTTARTLLEQVVSDAPDFARGHEALAGVYLVLPDWQTIDRDQAHQLAFAAAREALRLEPRLGEARAILAQEAFARGRWMEADRLFEDSLAREPANTSIMHWHAEFLIAAGKLQQAQDQAEAAVALDPLAPMPRTVAAWSAILRGGDDDAAAAHATEAVDLGLVSSRIILAWAAHRRGNDGVAARELAAVPHITHAAGMCAQALTEPALAPAARDAILGARRRDDLAMINHVICLGMLGFPRDAFELVRNSSARTLRALLWAPEFAELRQSEAFRDFLAQTGLPDYWTATGPPSICPPPYDDPVCSG